MSNARKRKGKYENLVLPLTNTHYLVHDLKINFYHLCKVARAATMKYHKLSGLNNGNLLSHSSGS